jgi:hypothetical protein
MFYGWLFTIDVFYFLLLVIQSQMYYFFWILYNMPRVTRRLLLLSKYKISWITWKNEEAVDNVEVFIIPRDVYEVRDEVDILEN